MRSRGRGLVVWFLLTQNLGLRILRGSASVCAAAVAAFDTDIVIRKCQQCRMESKLAEIVQVAVRTLLAILGKMTRVNHYSGIAIRVAGGTKSRIAQRSYEGSYFGAPAAGPLSEHRQRRACLPTRSSDIRSVIMQSMHLPSYIGT